jgi:hypothetical protein
MTATVSGDSTPGEGSFPDFVIVGAAKSATTSLDFYLSLHPEIFMARPKETNFFVSGRKNFHWERGVDWYRQQFRTPKRIKGECSPTYAAAPSAPMVPERMAQLIPNAKLIYILREPMERLCSHFLFEDRRQQTRRTFSEYLSHHPWSVDVSSYGTQYENFLRHFPRSQILLLESTQLSQQPQHVLRQVFEFLGANPDFQSWLFQHRRNVGSDQVHPSPLGRRIKHSRWMNGLTRILPHSIVYHLQSLILRPFRVPPPPLVLPDQQEAELLERFRREVALLRQLSGLELPSLTPRSLAEIRSTGLGSE